MITESPLRKHCRGTALGLEHAHLFTLFAAFGCPGILRQLHIPWKQINYLWNIAVFIHVPCIYVEPTSARLQPVVQPMLYSSSQWKGVKSPIENAYVHIFSPYTSYDHSIAVARFLALMFVKMSLAVALGSLGNARRAAGVNVPDQHAYKAPWEVGNPTGIMGIL